MDWYVEQGNEPMMKATSIKATIKTKETVKPKEFKRSTKENKPGRRKECMANTPEKWINALIRIRLADGSKPVT